MYVAWRPIFSTHPLGQRLEAKTLRSPQEGGGSVMKSLFSSSLILYYTIERSDGIITVLNALASCGRPYRPTASRMEKLTDSSSCPLRA